MLYIKLTGILEHVESRAEDIHYQWVFNVVPRISFNICNTCESICKEKFDLHSEIHWLAILLNPRTMSSPHRGSNVFTRRGFRQRSIEGFIADSNSIIHIIAVISPFIVAITVIIVVTVVTAVIIA